jgi:hypothetical protein
MATTAVFQSAHQCSRAEASAWPESLSLFVFAAVPLGLFGLIHLVAESMGVLPFFFAPFGLPHWTGATAHLTQLALVGAAYWAIMQQRPTSRTRFWLIALGAAYIALPFVTPMLDSMLLAVVCTLMFLLIIATMMRVGRESKLGGWLLAPMLAMVGLSAAMGLAVAAYAPPFALTQAQQAAPAA